MIGLYEGSFRNSSVKVRDLKKVEDNEQLQEFVEQNTRQTVRDMSHTLCISTVTVSDYK